MKNWTVVYIEKNDPESIGVAKPVEADNAREAYELALIDEGVRESRVLDAFVFHGTPKFSEVEKGA